MKKIIALLSVIVLAIGITQAADKISPYYNLGEYSETMDNLSVTIKQAIKDGGFEVVGEYHPEAKEEMLLIAFSSKELQKTVLNIEERSMLASVMKVALYKKGEKIKVSIVNPEYMFNAYFMDEMEKSTISEKMSKMTLKILNVFKDFRKSFTAFGGELSVDALRDYHYMWGMPYFTNEVDLKTFKSFEEGISTINKNLANKKGGTIKVYEIIDNEAKIAVFGVGLHDATEGESWFLPIIGEDNLAAMPYEIILEGEELTMLHGRYRFALYWPELTMGTFTQIMSAPGDVETAMDGLSE